MACFTEAKYALYITHWLSRPCLIFCSELCGSLEECDRLGGYQCWYWQGGKNSFLINITIRDYSFFIRWGPAETGKWVYVLVNPPLIGVYFFHDTSPSFKGVFQVNPPRFFRPYLKIGWNPQTIFGRVTLQIVFYDLPLSRVLIGDPKGVFWQFTLFTHSLHHNKWTVP